MSIKFLLTDFHGTIVDSNSAWIKAYLNLGVKNIEDITTQVYQKQSREKLALYYNIDYSLLLDEYRKNLHVRPDVISLIHAIHGNDNIIILSNSSKEKLYKDIEQVQAEHDLKFSFVYSKEDGNKNDALFIDELCSKHNITKAYMLGNDIREDLVINDNITNIFIPYKQSILLNKNI